VSVGH